MSDTRTIRDVLGSTVASTGVSDHRLTAIGSKVAGDLGLDPDTVLARMCETCEGRGTIDTSIHERHVTIRQAAHCPDCDGSGWVTVNRITVMPAWVADDGFRGFLLDPADQQALRIGRVVLASTPMPDLGFAPAYREGWNHARATFLAAGDDDE